MKLALVCAFVCSSLLMPLHCQAQEPAKPAEEKPATESKPAAEAKTNSDAAKTNPVKTSPTSLSSGKKKYGQDCAMCHGKEGAGDGDLAEDMHLKLRDFRDASTLKDLSDGDIYSIINNGKGRMPKYTSKLTPEEVDKLVDQIKAHQIKALNKK